MEQYFLERMPCRDWLKELCCMWWTPSWHLPYGHMGMLSLTIGAICSLAQALPVFSLEKMQYDIWQQCFYCSMCFCIFMVRNCNFLQEIRHFLKRHTTFWRTTLQSVLHILTNIYAAPLFILKEMPGLFSCSLGAKACLWQITHCTLVKVFYTHEYAYPHI